MTAHSYSLRSRVSSSSLSSRSAPQSPLAGSLKSPRKKLNQTSILQLKHVIGTTTTTAGGLSCCEAINSYAYAAGSVAVLATLDDRANVSCRYFKARPTAVPVHQTVSYYESPSASGTPTHRRTTFVPIRNCDDIGGTINRSWTEDSSSQTWSARERIKAVSCVALSPDGKILAVGETGYNPRVLLFSTAAKGAADTPLSIISDHNIGVCSIAFSPDSRYLATLGDVNDGFLYIWQVNTANGTLKLRSSNKCTTNVHDMSWIGDQVVTVGTRHIKVWQVSGSVTTSSPRRARLRNEGEVFSPTPAPLQGRNCLLGTLVDATFTAVVAISKHQAAVCTDDGHICLLDLTSGKSDLSPLEKTDNDVGVIAYRQDLSKVFWLGRETGFEQRDWNDNRTVESTKARDFLIDSKTRRRTSRQTLLRRSFGVSAPSHTTTVAMGCLGNLAIRIGADGTLGVSLVDAGNGETDVYQVASHDGSVQGVQELHPNANLGSFYTWTRSGEMRFWTSTGQLLERRIVELDDSVYPEDTSGNELKAVQYWKSYNLLVTGDRFGVLKVFELTSWTCTQSIRAHSAEFSHISISGNAEFLATGSRDRTVQIFAAHDDKMELLQTCDDHISAVTQTLFNHDGSRLLSCSADRTVVIRDRVQRESQDGVFPAFVPTRTVTLKAAPLSMCVVPGQPDVLTVATMDRYLVKIDIATGAALSTFKFSDPESDDTVFLNGFGLTNAGSPNSKCMLVGYSSIDKSVRIYDLEKGTLLARDAGHTEGVSDIVILDQSATDGDRMHTTVVSTGLDSTIMVWTLLAPGQPGLAPKQDSSQVSVSQDSDPSEVSTKSNPASLPPLRKLLSKLDITGGPRQGSPTREISPNGLRRRPSRLALASSIEETDENQVVRTQSDNSGEDKTKSVQRSPSPPSRRRSSSPKKQRSYSELRRNDSRRLSTNQSPAQMGHLTSLPTTPKLHSRVNLNGKLRRPPSVPNDLRTRAKASRRRSSVSDVDDHGDISMATEQMCHMLKVYNKKLHGSKVKPDLDELEAELETILQTVRNSDVRAHNRLHDSTKIVKHDDRDEMNNITVKLASTQIE